MLKELNTLATPQAAYGDVRKAAIIDVGSNSFRLIVMSYVPGYYYHMTDEVRESVRLAKGLSTSGKLQADTMSYAVEVMQLYAAFCKASDISDIIAVATSAVREASNGQAFLHRIEKETGIKVRLLSGEEEAYYGFLAAENSTTLNNGFVIDLGGGSLEITRVENRQSYIATSLTLGAVITTEKFLPHAPATKKAVNKLRNYLRQQLEELPWFKAWPNTNFVGVGGSLRNAARLIQVAKGYPFDELHGYHMQQADLAKVISTMEPLNVEQRRRLGGMKPDRADIALAGAIVVDECLRAAGYSELTVSGQGVREGLFYERFLSDNPKPIFTHVRRASIMNIAHLYHYQEHHCNQVAALALSLFDQIHAQTGDPLCGPAERELLWSICMLHDIGMTIDYNDHHEHGFYLILNSGLPGFSHRELALIALTTRYHRKGGPEADELSAVFGEGDMARLLKMTALLRLAEQLDRARDGSVKQIRLKLDTSPAQLVAFSDQDISVAVWSAQRHTDIFQEAFNIPLEIVVSKP